MVEYLPNGFERGGEVGVIHHPAEVRIILALNGDFDLEAMPVQPAAFVLGGQVGEEVGGFKLKGFAKFQKHGFRGRKGAQIRFRSRTR